MSPPGGAAPRCRVCGARIDTRWATAQDIEYGTTADAFDYFWCPDCDVLSIDPLPAGRLDEIYPSNYYSFVGSGSRLDQGPVAKAKAGLDRRRFQRLTERIARNELEVLDVGGGDGEVAERLTAGVHTRVGVTVVDFDAASIARARERGFEAWAGRFEDFECSQRFDVVLMLNLIEHVAEPVDVLAKVADVLAPGGLLWLQTPNFRSLDARLFRRRSWAGLHCPRHWTIFSDRGLRRTLAAAGLQPVEVTRTQGGSFWAASILGLRRARMTPTSDWRPLVDSPSYVPLAALGAAFDFLTRRFRTTSQTVVLAKLG